MRINIGDIRDQPVVKRRISEPSKRDQKGMASWEGGSMAPATKSVGDFRQFKDTRKFHQV